ncbi:MAG: VOC family protein [Planctomycetota bacterium]
MSDPFFFGIGGVVSADTAVPDHEAECRFYAKLLTSGSEPLWRDDLLNRHGTPIIGLGERTPEYESLPLQWMPHIQVADVAASAAAAVELGGRELMHGRDKEGNSQWAALTDPNGAAFGVIPVVDESAAAAYQSDGVAYVAWLSLRTVGMEQACAFYERVVGWSVDSAGEDGSRKLRRGDGEVAGAIAPAMDADEVPAIWMLHVPVGDLDESLHRATEHGGRILWRSSGSPGRAILRDPVGVCFGLMSHP